MNIIGFIRSGARNGFLHRKTWRRLLDRTTVEQDLIEMIRYVESEHDNDVAVSEVYRMLREAAIRRMGL